MARLGRPIRIIIACMALVGTAIVIVCAVALYLVVLPTNDRDNHDRAKRREMLAIVLDTCDLAPIPSTVGTTSIRTEGI